MKYSYRLPLISGFLFVFISCGGTKTLFKESSEDWIKGGAAIWQLNSEEIFGISESGESFIMTKDSYKNFILELEFYPDKTINSGIFVRCKNYNISNTECYEMNIWDLNPNQTYGTGSVVTRASPAASVETINKWNTYKIENKENQLRVWVNGILTADILDDDLVEGYVGLQAAETGTIKFRNVKITEL